MDILETERLILRQFRDSDCAAMTRVFGDGEVMRFGDGVQTSEWVRDWLRRCLNDQQVEPEIGPRAIVAKGDEDPIGYCGLFYFPDVDGQSETEIGYRLARSYWGRGYATEAALALRDFAFQTLGKRRLISMIDPQNVASIRVAAKIGMHYEKDVMLEGYSHPDRVYVVACSERME